MFKILVITDTKLSSINQCNSIINEITSFKKINLQHIKIKKKFFSFFSKFIDLYKTFNTTIFGFRFQKTKN